MATGPLTASVDMTSVVKRAIRLGGQGTDHILAVSSPRSRVGASNGDGGSRCYPGVGYHLTWVRPAPASALGARVSCSLITRSEGYAAPGLRLFHCSEFVSNCYRRPVPALERPPKTRLISAREATRHERRQYEEGET